MELQSYLDRVGFHGTPRIDFATLAALHRGHLLQIPYENFDVQLGRPVGFAIDAIFTKLVTQRRGGWCYEMNGLLGWALENIGFTVTRMAGGVGRALSGNAAVGNHLVLRVDLDRPYLADVGFGDGVLEPVPIAAGPIRQRASEFALQDLGGGWWRMHNDPRGGADTFDFQLRPASQALLDAKCHALQHDPDSVFVQNALCIRQSEDGVTLLRGKVLTQHRPQGSTTTVLADAHAYATALREVFGIDLPAARGLWPRIEARHASITGR